MFRGPCLDVLAILQVVSGANVAAKRSSDEGVLERAPEGLIPRLGGGDAAHEFLVVAHIEIRWAKNSSSGRG